MNDNNDSYYLYGEKLANHPTPVTDPLAPERAAVAREPAWHGEAQPRVDRMQTGAERIRAAASAAAGASPPRLASIVQHALDLLVHEMIPRLAAERDVLYPVLERVLGQPESTAALEIEQADIRIQTERLGALAQRLGGRSVGGSERRALERVLTDLSHRLLGHMERVTSLSAQARAVESGLDAGWDAIEHALQEAERRALDTVVLVVQPAVGSRAAIVLRHNPAANRAYALTLGDLARDGGSPWADRCSGPVEPQPRNG